MQLVTEESPTSSQVPKMGTEVEVSSAFGLYTVVFNLLSCPGNHLVKCGGQLNMAQELILAASCPQISSSLHADGGALQVTGFSSPWDRHAGLRVT